MVLLICWYFLKGGCMVTNNVVLNGENLILNGNFEELFTGWQVEGPSGEQKIIDSGHNKCLQLSALGRVSQELTINPNTTYTLNFHVQAAYTGGKAQISLGGNNSGTLIDESYNNSQMELKTITFKTGLNDSVLKLSLYCGGGEARFDNIVLEPSIPQITSAYVYNGGYIAINFNAPLSDETTFTMYINQEKRKSMTFNEGRNYWRGDVSFWGGSWAEAKDNRTKFELKTMVGNKEQTLVEFYGVSPL